MRPEVGFLNDILSHPEDDTVLLIYADWLEEHGGEAKAKLIRAQCEMEALSEEDSRHRILKEQVEKILADHREEWNKPFLKFSPSASPLTFRRGMSELYTSAGKFCSKQFQDRGEALFIEAGIQSLLVRDSSKRATILAQSPLLARLHTLRLIDCKMGDEVLQLLMQSPHIRKLRSLGLDKPYLSDKGARAIARSKNLESLEDLQLSGLLWGFSHMTMAGIRAILDSEKLGRLQSFGLTESWDSSMTLRALLQIESLQRLTTLSLSNSLEISSESLMEIANCPHLCNLKVLRIYLRNATEPGAKAILQSPYLQNLERLQWLHFGPMNPRTHLELQERFPLDFPGR